MANNNGKQVTGWVGWVYFAGFLMLITGILQMIAGLTALLNDKFYVVTQRNLLAFDFTTWGWVHLIAGLVILLAGMSVLSGHVWGRVVAVILAVLSAVINFVFIPAYPIWSITVIIIDVLIIHALTVHGGEAGR
ncbi:MAG TPA: hypothetical protein VFK11_04660 [Candidatus Saccharimonadales bacterium]|nr:hypothetical protein [Candidatus Saccharimonadales bacterium]